MNSFQKYKLLKEGYDYTSSNGYSARVIQSKSGKHIVKFFHHGEHMTHADYEGQSKDDAHEFAQDEIDFQNKKYLSERINKPEGHINVPDHITDGALEKRGRVKRMMGNRMPIEIIARILAGKVRE